MPKMKTNKAASKRFKIRKSGSVKRGQQGMTHRLGLMRNTQKRKLKKNTVVDTTQERTIKRLIQK